MAAAFSWIRAEPYGIHIVPGNCWVDPARPVGTASNPFPFLERVRRRIEESRFPGAEKLEAGRLTVSGGVACFPDDAATVDELIREADRQLYVSKAQGRNRITYRDHALSD